MDSSPESNPESIIEIDSEKLNYMLPIFDAVINGSETGRTGSNNYNSGDSKSVWSLLYSAIAYFVEPGDNGVVYTEGNIYKQVPAVLVKEYAFALFADFESLPPLPEDMGDWEIE